jgi:hypothetical protein
MSNQIIQEKIKEINELPTWSPLWFKKVAKEFLGTDEIFLNGKVGRDKEFTIAVACDNDPNFNQFKRFIAEYTFCFGMPILIYRKYTLVKNQLAN